MKRLLRPLLVGTALLHLTGCGVLGDAADVDTISYQPAISLGVGQSAIVHGGYITCGRKPDSWSDISHNVQKSSLGFFSNGGFSFMSTPCGRQTPVLGVEFTATREGSETVTVFGDPINITVGNAANFPQSNGTFGAPPQNRDSSWIDFDS